MTDRHHQVFFTSLAIASAGCSGYQSAPPDRDPPARVLTAEGPITDPEAVALAALYAGADPMKALPAMELVGTVDDPGYVDSVPTCSKSPCDPAWVKAAHHLGRHVFIVKIGGKLDGIGHNNVKEKLGVIDSAEKAALLAQLDEYQTATTCAQMARQSLACAPDSKPDHVPVRSNEGQFEVVTFSERNVCEGGKMGEAVVLGVSSVSQQGEMKPVDNALSKTAAAMMTPKTECRYPSRGRMFEGYAHADVAGSELDYFLRAAREEAAATVAFERLRAELEAHEAPAELVDAARRSTADEERHAELMQREASRIARALGVPLPPLDADVRPAFEPRPLFAMLSENAIEGCANETFAALVATYQAEHASGDRRRSMLRSIAADERDHALLAHLIHAWGLTQLSAPEAEALERTRRAACEEMVAAATHPLASEMGEPPPAIARAAFREAVAQLSSYSARREAACDR